jgi:two-component system, NarL family, response regulator, fimbrial Z protein, FimZ
MKTILIRDKHEVMAVALKAIAQLAFRNPNIIVENDDKKLVSFLKENSVDLVITDFYALENNPFVFLSTIAETSPHIKILVLSTLSASQIGRRCIDAGARGFLEKSADFNAYKEAMIAVANGEVYLCVEQK